MSGAVHGSAGRRGRFAALSALIALLAAQPATALFEVRVESGERAMPSGDVLLYDLFVPEPASNSPAPPFPAVVLTHGFARNRRFHRNNARYMAQRGIVVLTPDMSSLFKGRPDQVRNITNTVDHVRWLLKRNETPGDTLAGLLDPGGIGVAGHSAGGAVSFEAAVLMQHLDVPIAAVCLLDAVPWPRTLARANDLACLGFCSLRSEPSACNADGAVLSLLGRLNFPVEDVRIVGGTHCDPENPSDVFCSLACEGSSPTARRLYQRLMYLFFKEALGAPEAEPLPVPYGRALDRAERIGLVVIEPGGKP